MKRNTIKKATINKTSVENFYDVESSNGWDHYPLLITGPGACACHCPAGIAHKDCYHRRQALAELVYIPVIEDSLDEVAIARIKRLERNYWRGD